MLLQNPEPQDQQPNQSKKPDGTPRTVPSQAWRPGDFVEDSSTEVAAGGRKARTDLSKVMPKSEIIRKIAEQLSNEVTRDDIKRVLDALADVGGSELKQKAAFLLPGFAMFQVTEKPATAAHEGISPP
jgi:nucleoid DNA-binding protein